MISVAEAYQHILTHKKDYGQEDVSLLQSVGRVLAKPVFADADFPAFHRVTMDGIAVNKEVFNSGEKCFSIENMQVAGQPQLRLQNKNNCIEIMTGAMLPDGTNAVVPYEDCEIMKGIAFIKSETIRAFQNIHLQGSDIKAGDELLSAGLKITPGIIGILASVGVEQVLVKKLPSIAVCSTGDELIPIDEKPLPHQIRRSNVYTLAAALLEQGIVASLHHLPDDPGQMKLQLQTILQQHDAILFSGAVSMGKKDFLPVVLQQLGMKTIFHKVAQKPGKPMLFGVFESGTVIFGFPGNPVSTIVCYHVFFRKWLNECLGITPIKQSARLAEDFIFTPNLSFHLPVQIVNSDGCLWASPGFGTNSGDVVSLSKVDGIITLPAGLTEFKKGDDFELIMF